MVQDQSRLERGVSCVAAVWKPTVGKTVLWVCRMTWSSLGFTDVCLEDKILRIGYEMLKKRTPKIDTAVMLPHICILMIWEPLLRFLQSYAVPSLPFILAKIYIFKIQEYPFSIPRKIMQFHYLGRRLFSFSIPRNDLQSQYLVHRPVVS